MAELTRKKSESKLNRKKSHESESSARRKSVVNDVATTLKGGELTKSKSKRLSTTKSVSTRNIDAEDSQQKDKERRKSLSTKTLSTRNVDSSLEEEMKPRRKLIKKKDDVAKDTSEAEEPASKPKRKSAKKKDSGANESKNDSANESKKINKRDSVKKADKKPTDAKLKRKESSSGGNAAGKIQEDSRIVNHLYDDNIFDKARALWSKKMGKS